MKNMLKILVIAILPFLVLTADLPFLLMDLVPDADALLGVRRRAVRRTVVIGAAATETATANSASATAQQQSATAQQQSATAQQQSATAQQQAATVSTPPPSAATLPVGTIVHALPAADCPPKAIGGVEYYYCGGNYYRAAFQGSNLVYVTANPQ